MNAAEAKALADRTQAERRMRTYLDTIESAAKQGHYEQSFGAMDDSQVNAMKLLGFKVERLNGGNVSVRWGAV